MKEKLKECPWGHIDIAIKSGEDMHPQGFPSFAIKFRKVYWIECNKCFLKTNGFRRKSHLIEWWNKRPMKG